MRMISLPLGGLALAGLLLGCASTPDTSGTLPPVTSAPAAAPTSATPTASPTPMLPPIPPEAMAETLSGAQAFARYWFDVLNRAYDDGDPSLIVDVSDPSCKTCAGYVEELRQANQRQERYEGGHLSVKNSIAAPETLPLPVVLVDIESEPGNLLTMDGSVSRSLETSKQSLQMQLSRTGETWVALRIVVL